MTVKTVGLVSRRNFIRLVGGSAAAGLVASEFALADGHAKVNPEDAQPKALGYTEDASTTEHESFVDGSSCAKCALFSGSEGSEYGPCAIFGGGDVAAAGWCSAFAPKA